MNHVPVLLHESAAIAAVRIRRLDGASTWKFLD